MDTLVSAINWLILRGADALWAVWVAVSAFFVTLWGVIDGILNPVLSPVLAAANPVFTWIGDVVYLPLDAVPPWVGLAVLSALCGVLMLPVFKRFSNQAAIGRAKDAIQANLLALKLFKDDLGVIFATQARLLWAILRLQRYVLTPVLVAIPIMLPVLAQMGTRYQWRPLRPGEEANVRVRLAADAAAGADMELTAGEGVAVEAGPVPGGGQVVWRVRATEPGRHELQFKIDGATIPKELVVGAPGQRVSEVRPGRRWTSLLLHPVERPVPAASPITAIEIGYPDLDSWIYGSDFWIITFLVISMVVAIIFRPLFKVRF